MTDSRIIFALDWPSLDEAHAMASSVSDAVGMFKVGLELFVGSGPRAVSRIAEAGRPVFLDLKLNDIPETVDRAVARAASLGARMLTVHANAGPASLRRAVDRARKENTSLEIVAVTVLTSFDESDLAAVGLRGSVPSNVEHLARMAFAEGVRAFVCSPREAPMLRAAVGPEATIVTPGVRGAGSSGDDQKRTTTAREAILAGADWVVVGRPIRDAADPKRAAFALADEVEQARRLRSAG